MSKRFRISTMVTLAAFALVMATGVIAGDEWTEVTKPGEKMFDEPFTVDGAGRLRVDAVDVIAAAADQAPALRSREDQLPVVRGPRGRPAIGDGIDWRPG